MPPKVRKFSKLNALCATPSVPTEPAPSSVEFSAENQELKMDLATRKCTSLFNLPCSGALTGKAKWTDKTLDKYIKSPADYAPGKYSKFIFKARPKMY